MIRFRRWRAARTIGRVAQDERSLGRILDALEDRRTREELADRIDEMGQRKVIDPERIGEELFGDPATGCGPET